MNKKNFILIILVAILSIFLPKEAFADEKALTDITILLEDISVGKTPQEKTNIISEHITYGDVIIEWYESTDDKKYTKMTTSTYDYNVYYKAKLKLTHDDINASLDENYEYGSVKLRIIDEKGQDVATASISQNQEIEYVFSRIRKYKITTDLQNMKYEGPKEVIEGEPLIAQFIPNKYYRLPKEHEIRYYIQVSTNATSPTFNYSELQGEFYIEETNLTDDIYIKAQAVELEEIGLFQIDIPKYILGTNKDLEFVIDAPYFEFKKFYVNDSKIEDKSYIYDNLSAKFSLTKEYLETLKPGKYTIYVESNDAYIETEFIVAENIEENPNTFDNINTSIILLIISALGIITAIYYKNSNKQEL